MSAAGDSITLSNCFVQCPTTARILAVYDPDAGRYVEWSPETKHLESLLELSQAACLQLRKVDILAATW